MFNRSNAVLAGLAAACLVFLGLAVATSLQTLVALVVAIAIGGMATAVALGRRPPTPLTEAAPVTVEAPAPPPAQFQEQPVKGIRLPSAFADYTFAFEAKVCWLTAADGAVGAGEVAVSEIIRRALKVTERRDPNEVTLIEPELAVALGALHPAPCGRVQVRAESVRLLLPPEDQQRLDDLARLRKQEELWDHQRRYQVNKRRYLHTDVLKDPGSAVVWWLAQNEDKPERVADNIDVLSRLARAANNADNVAPSVSAAPRTSAEHFAAFLDALVPTPDDDERLTLASQVARLVDNHDQKTADEIRRRHSGPDEAGDGYQDCPEADAMPPL
jgi:hypothetical protein